MNPNCGGSGGLSPLSRTSHLVFGAISVLYRVFQWCLLLLLFSLFLPLILFAARELTARQTHTHTHTNTEIWMRDRHCVLCRSSAACLFSVRPLADILSTESGCAFPPLLIAGRKLASLGKGVWVSEWVSVCSCCCFCCYFVLLLLLLLAASDSFHGDAEHKWRQRAQLVRAICRAALCAQSLLPNWASIGHGQARPSSSRPTRSVGLHCRTFRREKTDSDWLNSSISSIGTGLSLLPLQCTWVWIADRGLLQN